MSVWASVVAAQAPDPSRAAGEPPPVERQSNGQAQAREREAERSPFPVRIVEDPDEAERAAEREQSAEEHDAHDLKAQQDAAGAAIRSADAAESQFWPMWAQIAS